MKKKIKVKGTLKHDFNVRHVLNLIERGELSHDESIRILTNACGVIAGLRCVTYGLCKSIDSLEGNKRWVQTSQWMGGEK